MQNEIAAENMICVLHQALPDLNLENVTMETRLREDLGMNSLDMMMAMIVLEDEYSLTFGDNIVFETVGDAIRQLQSVKPEDAPPRGQHPGGKASPGFYPLCVLRSM